MGVHEPFGTFSSRIHRLIPFRSSYILNTSLVVIDLSPESVILVLKMGQARRDACDSCHFRKIRCWSTTHGICYPCQSHGRTCVFGNRKAMGRPRKVKKPNPTGPLTPTPSRRSSISSPKGNSSSSEQASKPSSSSIWPGDANDDLGLDFGEAAPNQALECPIFDRLRYSAVLLSSV